MFHEPDVSLVFEDKKDESGRTCITILSTVFSNVFRAELARANPFSRAKGKWKILWRSDYRLSAGPRSRKFPFLISLPACLRSHAYWPHWWMEISRLNKRPGQALMQWLLASSEFSIGLFRPSHRVQPILFN